MNGIALAYSGVHQMFQLALAAHELGELDGLFCSVVDGEGKWGRRLGRWVPAATMRPLGWEALPQSRLHECPWPVLVNRALKKMLPFRQTELAAADVVLCCSEFQRQRLVALNPGISRVEVVPLWADVSFWSGSASQRQFSRPGEPLRVLYAGAVSLRKGVAYLLDAVESLQAEITLTMVGAVSPEMEGLLKRFRRHRLLPYLTKSELRNLYLEHDVLVMPTLGDSFGFVTVEAMASGMPVIASQNAGAPLPDESWRVPPHDAQAIHARLLHYHADREQLRSDAESASAFGAAFRPERYRVRAGELFKELLTA
jgi:glycosyltransferase involved in cell wall biosynthesis